jgi:hypothetical protein
MVGEEHGMSWKCLVSASVLSGYLLWLGGGAVMSQSNEERIPLIMTKLPPSGSSAYEAIKKRAGEVIVQSLSLTKAEMWSVPKANAEAVTRTAASHGVDVNPLSANWDHIFVPAPAGMAMSAEQRAMVQRAMSSAAATEIATFLPPRAAVVEYALTRGGGATPASEPAQIRVILNQETTVTIARTSVTTKPDMLIWRGRVEGTGAPATLMWWPGAQMAGAIHHEGRIYSIRCVDGVMHAIVRMNEDRMPPDHAPMPQRLRVDDRSLRDDPLVHQGDASILRSIVRGMHVAAAKAPEMIQDKGALQRVPPTTARPPEDIVIDVIVAYTKKVASNYTDVTRELIELAIEEGNESFRVSGIGHVKLRLVHAYQTDYVEEGHHFDHLWRFADADDGYMEEIHELRNKYRADVAALIVDDPKGCGLATRVFADPDEAFAVVHHDCAALTYSVAHEIGHLIGARHEISMDKTMTPFPYGHGYVNGTKWRDIMSYRESCNGCPRVPVWSNPNVFLKGEAAGTANYQNNARVIAEQAARVAAFR